jgi:hypothetical protein
MSAARAMTHLRKKAFSFPANTFDFRRAHFQFAAERCTSYLDHGDAVHQVHSKQRPFFRNFLDMDA